MPPTAHAPRTRDIIPSSFEELYSHYYSYVVKYVVKLGITPQNAEDVAQTVLAKFFEKDALSNFDQNYFEGSRKALFTTFLSGFVELYVRHYRDRQQKQEYREGKSIYLFTPGAGKEDMGDNHSIEWSDPYLPRTEETYEDFHFRELVHGIRAHLGAVRSTNSQDRCNMVDFFNAVLEQTYNDGKIDTLALSAQFGVSKTSIQNWLKRLRAEVAIVIEVA